MERNNWGFPVVGDSFARALVPERLIVATRPLRIRLARLARSVEGELLRSRRVLRGFRGSPPATLNEKIRFRMAADRRPLLTQLSDKWSVRSYVADRVGPGVLTHVHALVEDSGAIDVAALPRRCVIKATHGSGATIVVDDRADPTLRLPEPNPQMPWGIIVRIHPDRIDPTAFRPLVDSWLRSNYGRVNGATEWAYRNVRPRLMVEELLDAGDGRVPPDYKFWCFEGEVGFVQVDADRLERHTRSLHHPDWSVIDAEIKYPRPPAPPTPPPLLGELLRVATGLAAGLDFVRVDLYAVGGRVIFGEMTQYPGAGREPMHPEGVLSELGASWVPRRRR